MGKVHILLVEQAQHRCSSAIRHRTEDSLTGIPEQRTIQSNLLPLPQIPIKRETGILRLPHSKRANLAEEASTSSSRGYTPSPPKSQNMDQPIDLSNLLTFPGRGRGRGRGASEGREGTQSLVPTHGRHAAARADIPPGFSPEEIEASHRDKRQRLESQLNERLHPQSSTTPTPIWAPQLTHGNWPVTIRDNVESEGTAFALSQAFLLPGDMQKEVASFPDNLLVRS